jgi:hypothetical protein
MLLSIQCIVSRSSITSLLYLLICRILMQKCVQDLLDINFFCFTCYDTVSTHDTTMILLAIGTVFFVTVRRVILAIFVPTPMSSIMVIRTFGSLVMSTRMFGFSFLKYWYWYSCRCCMITLMVARVHTYP